MLNMAHWFLLKVKKVKLKRTIGRLKFLLISLLVLGGLYLTATGGSLTPSASPAGTFHTLAEIWNSIAATDYDSSSISASTTGSLLQGLKYINNNLFWASTSGNIWTASGVNRIGIGTSTPTTKLEVQGTASASYGLFGALQIAGFTSQSYSRFGIGTTTHTNYISAANDLFISGDLEGRGSISFAGSASISNAVRVTKGTLSADAPSPTLVGTYNTSGNAFAVYVSGRYAYVADDSATTTAGLNIIDVSNPSTPVLVGRYNTAGNRVYSVYVSGKYAYIANVDSGLLILDISNPSSPVSVGSYNTSGASSGIYVSGKYAYVADSDSGLQIINVSDPTSPTLVGTYDTPGGNSGANSVVVSGKYAYVADDSSGYEIIDISNPSSPTLVAAHDVTDEGAGGGVDDIFVSGKYIYLADDASGLRITGIKGIDTHAINAGNVYASEIFVTENMDIGNDLYARNGIVSGPGGILSNGAISLNKFNAGTSGSPLNVSLFSINQASGSYNGDSIFMNLAGKVADTFTGNFLKFQIASVSRILFESSGAILASGAAQFGSAGAPTSVSYSRFGTGTTTHAGTISAAQD